MGKNRLVIFFAMLALACAPSKAQGPREHFNQLVERLRTNATDDTLREKIIKQAQELKPAPAIPEQARAAFVEGNALAKSAKDASQQLLAVQSFKDALKVSPWWGDAYYNLAVAQELAGQFDAAQSSLKLYLLTNPGEAAAREAQDRIYAINAKKKLAVVQQSSPAAIAEREQATLQKLNGAQFVRRDVNPFAVTEFVIEVLGDQVISKFVLVEINRTRALEFGGLRSPGESREEWRGTIRGRFITGCTGATAGRFGCEGKVSDDDQYVEIKWVPGPGYSRAAERFTRR